MQTKYVCLLVLIASIKMMWCDPILGPLGGVGGGGKIPGVGGGAGFFGVANPYGVLYGFNSTLEPATKGLGISDPKTDGALSGTRPVLGETVNSLGIGSQPGTVKPGGCDGKSGQGQGGHGGYGGSGGDGSSGGYGGAGGSGGQGGSGVNIGGGCRGGGCNSGC